MTNILDLARQAGFTIEDERVWFGDEQRWHCTRELQAFAVLVRNAALEEAAVKMEWLSNLWIEASKLESNKHDDYMVERTERLASVHADAAGSIRALGDDHE